MTIRRRDVLQIGGALATLSLTGCAGGRPEPASPSASPAGVAEPGARIPEAPPAATPTGGAPPQVNPGPASDAAKPQAPATGAEPPKVDLARVIARVGKNHGHVLTVALADVLAGAEKT